MRYGFPTRSSISSSPSRLSKALLVAGVGGAALIAARTMIRRLRFFDVRDKVAIVAGGSTGIGFAIATELVSRGAQVAICARHEKELRAAQKRIEEQGGTVVAATCDITNPEHVGDFVQLVRNQLGSIDIVVNCAGTIIVGPISHMQTEDFKHAMDTNFYGPLNVLLEVMPEMRRRGQGRIVNITSFGGKVPVPHMASYAASKFAIVGLSETLRTELVDDGIFVTTVCPGLVRSGSTPNALFKGQQEKEKVMFETMANMPIITVSPDKLARKIVSAMQHGDPELILPWPAKLQAKMHGLLPSLTAEFVTVLNAFMPSRSKWASGDQRRPGANINVDDKLAKYVKAGEAFAEKKFQHRGFFN